MSTIGGVLLHAKQLEIDDLRFLHTRAMLAGMAGHLIHCLQSERGASSIYIASKGQRFSETLQKLIDDSRTITSILLSQLDHALSEPALANRKITNQLAWALLGLEVLDSVRTNVESLSLSGEESVKAYSQLIDVLIKLIFELADTSINPVISKLMISLFSLIEGKELAGQERAVGALAFAGGYCSKEHQCRLVTLKESQERSFETFVQFCEHDVGAMLGSLDSLSSVDEFLALRTQFQKLKVDRALEKDLSDTWFNCCSDRIAKLWNIQQTLVDRIQKECNDSLKEATKKLENSEELIKRFMSSTDQKTVEQSAFFQQHSMAHRHSNFRLNSVSHAAPGSHELYDLVHQQSSQLALAESELQDAQRLLEERKIIERAKGILMAKMNVSEEAAHRELRSSAMRHNQKLVDVAELIQKIGDWR